MRNATVVHSHTEVRRYTKITHSADKDQLWLVV